MGKRENGQVNVLLIGFVLFLFLLFPGRGRESNETVVRPVAVPFAGDGCLAEATERVGQYYDQRYDDALLSGSNEPTGTGVRRKTEGFGVYSRLRTPRRR